MLNMRSKTQISKRLHIMWLKQTIKLDDDVVETFGFHCTKKCPYVRSCQISFDRFSPDFKILLNESIRCFKIVVGILHEIWFFTDFYQWIAKYYINESLNIQKRISTKIVYILNIISFLIEPWSHRRGARLQTVFWRGFCSRLTEVPHMMHCFVHPY